MAKVWQVCHRKDDMFWPVGFAFEADRRDAEKIFENLTSKMREHQGTFASMGDAYYLLEMVKVLEAQFK